MADQPRSTAGDTPADVVADAPARPHRSDGPRAKPKNGLDRYFEITARRSTVTREVRGGLTTFFTMAYIVVLNPIILSGADVTGASLPFASVAAVTAATAAIGRMLPSTSALRLLPATPPMMIGLSTTM